MTDRRNFLKTTAAFTMGSMASPLFSCTEKKDKVIGLQLYTVRDKIKTDLDGTLNRLAEIGYNSMEAAGYSLTDGTFYGLSPKEFSVKLRSLGMPLTSSHSIVEPEDADKVFTDSAEAGCNYVIYPYLAENFRKSIDGYKATAEKFNKIGEVANKYNIRFGYHNHAFEFEKMDGQMGMDVLIAETDPSLVTFEVDLYWVTRGGQDPVEYIKKFPGRFELYHLKDMVKTEDMFFAPVGSGRIDFKSIFEIKVVAGMKMFYVEQDRFRDLDPFESVEMSLNYIKNAPFI